MDGPSEHPGDPEGEDGDVASLSSRLSGIKSISGLQTPTEPPEPLPQPQPEPEPQPQPEPGTLEVSTGGAAEDEPAEPAEPREGPVATEVGDEPEPGEPEGPAEPEPEPGEPTEAGPEEIAQSGPEGGLAEAEELAQSETEVGGGEGSVEGIDGEKEWEEVSAAPVQRRKKEAPSQVSVPLPTSSREEAVSAPEAEREEEEGEEETSKDIEERGVLGSPARSLVKPREREESLDEEAEEWSREVRKREEQQLRAELLEQYRARVVERDRLQRYSTYLQHRISEALRKKRGPEAAETPDKGTEPDDPEKEQAYLRHLAILEELRKQQADDLDWYHRELEQLKQEGKESLSRVEAEWRAFQALKKQVVMQALGNCRMRGGRQAALREVGQIQELEEKKEKEMSAVRLENVQLRQSLVHLKTRMRAQEDMAEGLLLIDFEQLKIENQAFSEKVEERNEDLLKLRNKVANNVQVITHVKEKLHFVDIENAWKKAQLLEIEAQVALRRDILTKTKQARDRLRIDNIKLSQKCGLVGKEPLLRDLEETVDKTALLRQHLESLKCHHAGLTMSCRGVRQKIRGARAFLPF